MWTEWGVGLFSSIALDSAGYPHISYYDYTSDDLKYALDGEHLGNSDGGF
jgi:hypothetical protein